jgi:signal peptidase I
MAGSAVGVSGLAQSRGFWVDVFLGLATALTLGVVLKALVLGAVLVPSASMEGTLLAGDFVLVDKLGRGGKFLVPALSPGGHSWIVVTPSLRRTQRGDIVLFRPPAGLDPDQRSGDRFFVKRCIATEGDTVEFSSLGVAVNGKILHLPATAAFWRDPSTAFARDAERKVIVPGGAIFLLGDNPIASSDSRAWGCIPEYDVAGRVALIYWSRCAQGEDGETSGVVRWERIGTVLR